MREKKNSEAYFARKAVKKELKKWKTGKIQDLSWLSSLDPATLNLVRDGIVAKVEEDLKKEGLFRGDKDPVILPLENGIPLLVKRKPYKKETSDKATDDIYDPEGIDLEFEDALIPPDAEEWEEAYQALEPAGESLHPYLPKLAVSSTQFLMRRYPLDLRESLARELFDSHAFMTGENKPLLPALCFFEVGINDLETFQTVWEEAYKGGPFYLDGKKFTFQEFQKDKLKLFHRLKREKERYFKHNPWLRDKSEMASLWERFNKAHKSLTRKQWNAIKQVRVRRRSQKSVAKDMRIDVESLRDRLEGAELKFRRAIPELAGFFPSETYKQSQETNYIHDGLFDKREKAAPLYREDPKTKEKTEIPKRTGKKKYKEGMNVARIKAWAYDSTPVPDFSFTEFFTRLMPDGALLRQSAGDKAPHDCVSVKHGFTDRMKAHEKRRPSSDLPDDEPSDD